MSIAVQDLRDLHQSLYNSNLVITVYHHVYFGRGDIHKWSRIYSVAKLLELDEFELSYVDRILRSVLESSDSVMDIMASRKYSFQDCDDWYSVAELASVPADCTHKTVYLETVICG